MTTNAIGLNESVSSTSAPACSPVGGATTFAQSDIVGKQSPRSSGDCLPAGPTSVFVDLIRLWRVRERERPRVVCGSGSFHHTSRRHVTRCGQLDGLEPGPVANQPLRVRVRRDAISQLR